MSIIARFHDGSIIVNPNVGGNYYMITAMLDNPDEKKLIVSDEGGNYLYDVIANTATPLILPLNQNGILPHQFFKVKYFIKIDDLYIMHINDSSYALSSLDAITWEIMAGYPILT